MSLDRKDHHWICMHILRQLRARVQCYWHQARHINCREDESIWQFKRVRNDLKLEPRKVQEYATSLLEAITRNPSKINKDYCWWVQHLNAAKSLPKLHWRMWLCKLLWGTWCLPLSSLQWVCHHNCTSLIFNDIPSKHTQVNDGWWRSNGIEISTNNNDWEKYLNL